jgi:integrase
LDYYYLERGVSATTYNNQIKAAHGFFSWAKQKCYCTDNPFDDIRKKRKLPKARIIIPPETRQRIADYLTDTGNQGALLTLHLTYSSLIRPKEINMLRIGDVNLEGKYIEVQGDISKNHKTRYAALSDASIAILEKMKIKNYPKNYYLLGGTELSPSERRAARRRYRQIWEKVRRDLQLPAQMQVYSLRDTGITEMLLGGLDDLTVMQHADHSSLDMTSVYAKHHDPNLIERVRKADLKF